MTIWMSDEESPDNIHTRFRQTSAAINAIFISRTLKLFRKYSGQGQYQSQFCSQLSEQIDRLKQTPFSNLDPRVFASTDKR